MSALAAWQRRLERKGIEGGESWLAAKCGQTLEPKLWQSMASAAWAILAGNNKNTERRENGSEDKSGESSGEEERSEREGENHRETSTPKVKWRPRRRKLAGVLSGVQYLGAAGGGGVKICRMKCRRSIEVK
jgi:hypothetical protein